MQLRQYTDYSLRVLIFLGLNYERVTTVTEISESYGISRNHLVKIVHQLGQYGYIVTKRGKGGGIRLSRDPAEISLGDVVRNMEGVIQIVECFNAENRDCGIYPGCQLKSVLAEAVNGFFAVLDKYNLQDLVTNKRKLRSLLNITA